MRTKLLFVCTLCALALFATSCGSSVLGTCDSKATAKQLDEDHRDTICYAGIEEKYFLKENDEHTARVVVYSIIKWEDMEGELQRSVQSMKDFLSRKNEEDANYIDVWGLGPDMAHRLKVIEFRLSMVRAARVFEQFKVFAGQVSPYEGADMRNGYDVKKIAIPQNFAGEMFSFITPEIEAAKKDGRLEKIGELNRGLSEKYGKKEKDPAHPDDPNAFRWLPEGRNYHFVAYRIAAANDKPNENPTQNVPQYIEGFKTVNGKDESKPAFRLIRVSDYTAIAIIDSKREGKDPAFGLPDFVEQSSIRSLGDVESSGVLAKMFPKQEPERKDEKPKPNPIVVEISPMDGKPRDVWEENKAGWPLPSGIDHFRIGPKNENYKIRIDLRHPKHGDDHAEVDASIGIESFVKVWTTANYYSPVPGAVWEYYRPKGKFAKRLKASVLDSQKKVQFDFEDGTQAIVTIVPHENDFIENEPYAIAYTDGKVRYRLEKSSGSEVFDKRRIWPMPKDDASGVYSAPRLADDESFMDGRASLPGSPKP